MDIRSLREQSDLSFNRATAKQNALEKARSRQIVTYNSHIFRADAETINLISVLKQQSTVFILDVNQNPCEINNPRELLDLLITRNQEALNQYHQLYQQLKQR